MQMLPAGLIYLVCGTAIYVYSCIYLCDRIYDHLLCAYDMIPAFEELTICVRGRNVIITKRWKLLHTKLSPQRIMNRQRRPYPLVLPESREKITKSISEEVTHELGFQRTQMIWVGRKKALLGREIA